MAALVARVLVQSRPARLTVTKFDEIPAPGAIVRLPDGTRVKIKKAKAARPDDMADLVVYAKPV